MRVEEHDVVILGGGLTGLAAATQLGEHAVVLEKDERPGGLVRSVRLGEWWFDDVLHLLYFWDPETERIVRGLLGRDLSPCVPEAYVVVPEGTVRYPFQMHLGGLHVDTKIACLKDFAAAAFGPKSAPPYSIADVLEQGFGSSMCEAFLFPYNRKLWKRPLESLAPDEFRWNIPRPDIEAVLRGALDPTHVHRAYNAGGFYPCPPVGVPVRGMEVLSRALAGHVADLRTGHELRSIDPARREVVVHHGGQATTFRYRETCMSSLPMPMTLAMCRSLPRDLAEGIETLRSNRVVMVYVAIRGPRPNLGHWRYYGDESICFTRLVFMHEFDPHTAPADGWGLMAELTERSEDPLGDLNTRIGPALRDARRVGALREAHDIVATTVKVFDPAYVVFTHESAEVMRRSRAHLGDCGVTPLGRYGRWEYKSMAQVMRDGLNWGRAVADRLGHVAPEQLRWAQAPASEEQS